MVSPVPQLGRHVRRRAELVPHRLLVGRDLGCEAEVNELELRLLRLVLIDEVVQLDVAVDLTGAAGGGGQGWGEEGRRGEGARRGSEGELARARRRAPLRACGST